MKRTNKLIIQVIFFICIFGINNIVYGTERFVDIPVPPGNSGYADYSSEDAQKAEKEYEETQKITNNSGSEFVIKSSNNYLKKLEIKGYKLQPEFSSRENDYTLDLQNNGEATNINIVAEAEDNKSQIQGDGTVLIKEGQDVININVIAENRDLNVYTIKLKNSEKTEQSEIQNDEVEQKEEIKKLEYRDNEDTITIWMPTVGVSLIGLIFLMIIKKGKKKKKGKHVKRG